MQVRGEMKGDNLVLTIDCSKAARDAAQPSKTGKTVILASTALIRLNSPPTRIAASYCFCRSAAVKVARRSRLISSGMVITSPALVRRTV